jgi:hypothetical protein
MLLDMLWVIAVSAALVVFFAFYLAFAYLLFSPLLDYLIEQAFRGRPKVAWGSRAKASFRIVSAHVREWLNTGWIKTKNPDFQR